MDIEMGSKGKDAGFVAPETGQQGQESSSEGQDTERLAKIKEVYSKEVTSASGDVMWKYRSEEIKSAMAGGQNCPGNWQVLKGKTLGEAAKVLATELLTRNGTVAALEMSEMPDDEKAEILAQYYDAFAKAVEKHPHTWGMGKNEKVNKEMIEESIAKARLLRGE